MLQSTYTWKKYILGAIFLSSKEGRGEPSHSSLFNWKNKKPLTNMGEGGGINSTLTVDHLVNHPSYSKWGKKINKLKKCHYEGRINASRKREAPSSQYHSND